MGTGSTMWRIGSFVGRGLGLTSLGELDWGCGGTGGRGVGGLGEGACCIGAALDSQNDVGQGGRAIRGECESLVLGRGEGVL